MNEIIKVLEEHLKLNEGAESAYELGYEDAIKYVLNLLKTKSDVHVPGDRG